MNKRWMLVGVIALVAGVLAYWQWSRMRIIEDVRKSDEAREARFEQEQREKQEQAEQEADRLAKEEEARQEALRKAEEKKEATFRTIAEAAQKCRDLNADALVHPLLQPKVHDKLLVWNLADGTLELDGAPPEREARWDRLDEAGPNEVTLIVITERKHVPVGKTYQVPGQSFDIEGYRTEMELAVAHWPVEKGEGRVRIVGNDPPDTALVDRFSAGGVYGEIDPVFEEWIRNLPRTNADGDSD